MRCPEFFNSVVSPKVTPRGCAAPHSTDSTSAGLLPGMQLHPDKANCRTSARREDARGARLQARAWSCVAEVMVSHWAQEGVTWGDTVTQCFTVTGVSCESLLSRRPAEVGHSHQSLTKNLTRTQAMAEFRTSLEVLFAKELRIPSWNPAFHDQRAPCRIVLEMDAFHRARQASSQRSAHTLSLPMPPSPTPRNQSPTGKVTLATATQRRPWKAPL